MRLLVANEEPLNLSLRWVDDEYVVNEDPIGLFVLPNTTADTITSVIKDLLIRCDMPLSLCRGQAYDGAANMQGKRKGVATLYHQLTWLQHSIEDNEQPSHLIDFMMMW